MASSPRVPKLEPWPEPLVRAFHAVESALRDARSDAPATSMRVVGSVNRLLRVLETVAIAAEHRGPVRQRVDELMGGVSTLLDGVNRAKNGMGRRRTPRLGVH